MGWVFVSRAHCASVDDRMRYWMTTSTGPKPINVMLGLDGFAGSTYTKLETQLEGRKIVTAASQLRCSLLPYAV